MNTFNCDNKTDDDAATTSTSHQAHQSPSLVFRTKIQSLIRNDPDMIQSTDALGMNPLHILACYCTNKNMNSSNNTDFHSRSCRSDVIPQIMNEIIDLRPTLTERKNRNGMTPLDLYIKCCFCRAFPTPLSKVSLKEENTKTDFIASKMSEISINTDASLNISDGTNHHQCLPLCLLIKMGMGWKDIQKIIQINPNAALERGLVTPMTRTTTWGQLACDEISDGVSNDKLSHVESKNEFNNADSNLYPFMQAAVKGNLELAYNLALYR
eukprot:CAMPEP_0203683762 /NCGR_PEP_ID=MMETSP0090-20130426/47688_1 /ASSEMBLY_ACC=CAM_ASM_001088 /TAXON_ID=426623 /ORGANISM="Chaetoceros affinis, Strain CCMP159" /LENGTH=267 /DNA_ID=CAMNT_0050552917 /DNA_START=832 /DNA_END=1632 /DNA_ORIENTATION=-